MVSRKLATLFALALALAGCAPGTVSSSSQGSSNGESSSGEDAGFGSPKADRYTDAGGSDAETSTDPWADSDGDGRLDTYDNCPTTSNYAQKDADRDGVGDKCDNCKAIPNKSQADSDGNGEGDACQGTADPNGDPDGDGLKTKNDNCPGKSNANQADKDKDGVGDPCDNCPGVANYKQKDTNRNGQGNRCENSPVSTDMDGDGVPDARDTCPSKKNPGQTDTDGDGVGDACDNCKKAANKGQLDKDNDGTGNACENLYNANRDSDGDGTPDIQDTCPKTPNPNQADADGDRRGDACDNCPRTSNYHQVDSNNNGRGDACAPNPVGKICKRKNAHFKKLKPNIFVVLDKSGSMGSNNKMGQAKSALNSVVNNLWNKVRFGLLAYSSSCSPPPLLRIGSHSAATIKNSYRNVRAGGGTGTGGALRTVRSSQLYWNRSNPNRAQRKKAVILVSDGCANNCGGQSRAASEASRLHSAGVDVYSIGFQRGACTSQLNQVARNGGTSKMYQANNATQLANVLKNISSKVISCSYKVNAPSSNKIWVKVGGSTISQSQFTYNSSTGVLTLKTNSCNRLKSLSATHANPLEIVFGCPAQCQKKKEICNFKDDDCDGKVDEGCSKCTPEVCGNGKDDDCDGKTDEGCPPQKCTPNKEICDGKDNNCNGQVDEGCGMMCTPKREVCDGKDNDCDGQVDEGCIQCKPRGESCKSDGDCCNGNCRNDGTCGPPCKPTGVSCTAHGECCSGTCSGQSGRAGMCLGG